MTHFRPRLAAFIGICLIEICTPAVRADVNVTSWDLRTKVVDGANTIELVQNSGVVPVDPPSDLASLGLTEAESSYDFLVNSCGSFAFNFTHGVSTNFGAYATSFGTLTFDVGSDDELVFDFAPPCPASTVYSVEGTTFSHFEVSLFDVTANAYLLQNIQEGDTQDVNYVLGEPGPDFNLLTGSITGALPAGHTFRLDYNYRIERAILDAGSAIGFGHLDLKVHPASPLSIICPPDLQVDSGQSTDPEFTGTPTTVDSCDPEPLTYYDDVIVNGTCPESYSILRTWTVVDIFCNTATCLQTIEVQGPGGGTLSIDCPPDFQLQCGESSDPSDTGIATVTGGCGGTVDVDYLDESLAPNCTGQDGIVRTWTATDDTGHQVSCVQTITFIDTTPPVITCPADEQLQCGDSPNGSATATDNCDINPTITFADAATPANCTGEAGIERTWKATDACSNESTCVQIITFIDTTPPVITCPPDKELQCGDSTDPSDTGSATATDNCDSSTITHTDAATPANCTGEAGIDRTWKAEDACGNESTCVQHITFVDTTPPVITCPPDKELQCGDSTNPSNTGSATASDNCDGSPTITSTDAAMPANCTGKAGIDRTWKAKDDCGNESTCVQHITFVDTTPPTIGAAGANATINCPNSPVFTPPTATDNCGMTVVNLISDVTTNQCGNTYGRTLTWDASDACGNHSGTVSQTINVVDTTPPILSGCPANASYQCLSSVPAAPTVTANDSCNGAVVVSFSQTQSNPGSNCQNTITRTWSATDSCGNPASCSQTITVNDTTPPVITCPQAATVACGGSSLPAATGTATASDTCGTANVTYSDSASTSMGCGNSMFTRTWKAVDACSNQATCTQTISMMCGSGSISGTKWYDSNANGVKDSGEAVISNWKITLTGPIATQVKFTDTSGNYSFTGLPPGTYTVTETIPANWQNTTPASVSVTTTSTNCSATVNFGNYCFSPPANGYTPGFWGNNNGRAVLAANDSPSMTNNWRVLLNALNLRKEDGSLFKLSTATNASNNFTVSFATAYSSFNSWLQGSNATNMAYKLSSHLAAATLNVNYKGLSDNTVIVVPGGVNSGNGESGASSTCIVPFLSVTQSITCGSPALLTLTAVSGSSTCGCTSKNATVKIGDLRMRAKCLLGTYNLTTSAGVPRTYEEMVKDLLDMINNNGNNGYPCGPLTQYKSDTICGVGAGQLNEGDDIQQDLPASEVEADSSQ